MKTASDLRIPFAWKDRRPVLLEKCLYIPSFFNDHEGWEKMAWSDPRVFGNENPVVIEFCSGNGQWICDRAQENPNQNFVAVEKRFDRARKIWARLHRDRLSNLFVVCAEAVVFTQHYVPFSSVSEIFVNFPDPWPKLRHAKHRLIREEFTKALEGALLPGARAVFSTDDKPYGDQMLEVILKTGWKSLYPDPFFITNLPDFGSSYFCDLWKKKGRTIYHLLFEVSL